MDCSTSGFPVPHHLPEFAQVHVHWISDAIQPSHPLSPPSPPALNLSQHQGLFQWVVYLASGGQSTGASASASVFQWVSRIGFLLRLTGLISLLSKGLSRMFSNTAVRKHQFFSAQSSLWSGSHIHTWLLERLALTIWTFAGKVMSLLFNNCHGIHISYFVRVCVVLWHSLWDLGSPSRDQI